MNDESFLPDLLGPRRGSFLGPGVKNAVRTEDIDLAPFTVNDDRRP